MTPLELIPVGEFIVLTCGCIFEVVGDEATSPDCRGIRSRQACATHATIWRKNDSLWNIAAHFPAMPYDALVSTMLKADLGPSAEQA